MKSLTSVLDEHASDVAPAAAMADRRQLDGAALVKRRLFRVKLAVGVLIDCALHTADDCGFHAASVERGYDTTSKVARRLRSVNQSVEFCFCER